MALYINSTDSRVGTRSMEKLAFTASTRGQRPQNNQRGSWNVSKFGLTIHFLKRVDQNRSLQLREGIKSQTTGEESGEAIVSDRARSG